MLTSEEKETIILFDRAGIECKIYSVDRTVTNKLDKLYKCIKAEEIDGETAKTYLTSKRYISFRKDPAFKPDADNTKPKRMITAEHLEKMQAARRQTATKLTDQG